MCFMSLNVLHLLAALKTCPKSRLAVLLIKNCLNFLKSDLLMPKKIFILFSLVLDQTLRRYVNFFFYET